MSLGTDRYTFRLPKALMDVVAETIARRNDWTRNEPWDLSEFVRVALREKVKKMARSRRRVRRNRAPVTVQQ